MNGASGPLPASGPAVGTVVVDEERDRIGHVMDHEGGLIQLRPLGGGREWDADPVRVRLATPAERLSAAVAVANAASRDAAK